jgi:exodeoxyribonuclease VII large subunit
LHYAVQRQTQQCGQRLSGLGEGLTDGTHLAVSVAHERLERAGLRLRLLDPRLVLLRGYALLQDSAGQLITRVGQTHAGQTLEAQLADGRIAITVGNEG